MIATLFSWSRCKWVGALVALTVSLGAQEPTPYLPVAETPFDFRAGWTLDEALPAPETVLGYAVGEAYADYGAVLRLVDRYRGSERLMIEPTGMTNERRPMQVLVISSPENLARLEEIKAANQRLVDGRAPLSGRALDRAVAKQPIIVWLGYNIHGDEAAGTEAAMQVLYTLLASRSAEVEALLRDVVVVMNPCQNPDGRERFVVWANAHGIGRPERFAWEKENPWNVQGRYNHYYFDLNRDMIALSQVESRNTAAAYLEWMPQVAADHHGETKEYFFPPAMLPINPQLPREQTERWQDVFGRANAAAFDAQHWLYYVRDDFDIFYPGYWDSWPSLQGATGMTYETSGGGKRGRNYRRDDGTTMTLRQAIAKHFVASMTTIRTAAANRDARLRDFHAAFVDAVAVGRQGEMQQVFLPGLPFEHPLSALLRGQGIEVQQLNERVRLTGARDFEGRDVSEIELAPGTLVVDLAQPRGPLARALLQTHSQMDAAFVERQLAKVERNRERGDNAPEDDYEFYDQTAWSLPLLFGVEAYQTATPVDLASVATTARSKSGLPPVAVKPALSVKDATAWVLPVDQAGMKERALSLLRAGYRVSAAVKPLQVGNQSFPAGSLVVRAERNPADVVARLGPFSLDGQAAGVVPVHGTFTEDGSTGVGSVAMMALKVPKVIVAAGDPVTPASYGAMYHLLDTLGVVDYVPVAADRLGSLDLSGFNVVILPSAWSGRWSDAFDEDGRAHLRSWMEQGGTLICLGGAAEFAVDADTGWTDTRLVGVADGEDEEVAFDDQVLPLPGALLRATIEPEHFLSFGYAQTELPYFADGDAFFQPSTTGTNVVRFADENLWVSGHIWPENTERLLARAAAVIDEPIGDGHLILFSDEPGYRAMWHASVPMLLNALLYAPGLQNDVGSYVR
ncbi:M14 family zinc carboxypeptidase [Actomonas aquatica]|uniref:M14 family zinc carboxypeptidase n=1 Tax=Actomonas aquatica TaxID=2866162 RepID=A0ABZ1CC26_9BACT|nr:M14 family zinc carboxypeptidase [Opitutus sp. WL0086]WRQ88996.1 M14 family zinc carboxypeptidase [Opitutus sp. WL0086]